MTTKEAFNAGLSPFQEIRYKFDNGEALNSLLPQGHWLHDSFGSIYIPTGAIYNDGNGKIRLCEID